jgi:diguanylate cyclase (GGDEF)-like protein
MQTVNRLSVQDLPELPQARQLKAGIPLLMFGDELEGEFLRSRLEESIPSIRINTCLAILIAIAFSANESLMLGRDLNRIPSLLHILIIVPTLLIVLAASFSSRRQRIYQPLAAVAGMVYGLTQVAIELVASSGGVGYLFPSLVLATMYVYFLAGLTFYYAVAANLIVLLLYLAAEIGLQLTNSYFSYNAIALVAANLIGMSVVYMHERTSRLRFLEAGTLREMVARDGLTGIQNRRMFDQHIERVWQQAVREERQLAVLLADIDCFKNYNDHYGHQAGDECLRAVATSLTQCARRPLDFVARYGGEEFAVILYEANREYVAEVLTRIQRSIAELNIAHDASVVASRLTLSIGAAFVQPSLTRTVGGLIQLADEALYTAKEQGRNRVVVMEAEYQALKTGRFEKQKAGARH